jgi:EAL domain-containing protein (putative c-di-GMP-specific phosphodiesterase class I)
VAEGVETETQEERLRELGSDFAQGYLYSPGRPIDDVERLIIAPAVQARV